MQNRQEFRNVIHNLPVRKIWYLRASAVFRGASYDQAWPVQARDSTPRIQVIRFNVVSGPCRIILILIIDELCEFIYKTLKVLPVDIVTKTVVFIPDARPVFS